MLYLLFFILGSCCASFLVVVAERVPLNLSVIQPRSYCLHCHQTLPWRDLWPIIAYIRLRGRCSQCQQPFSPLSFVSEVLLGSLFAWLLYLDAWQLQYLSLLLLLLCAFSLSLTDLLYLRIEPWLFYPLTLLSSLSLLFLETPLSFHVLDSLLIFLALSLLNLGKSRLGRGDIKLLTTWACFFGLDATLHMILAGSLIALLFSAYYYQKRATLQGKLPFVPFLSIGLFLYILRTFWI